MNTGIESELLHNILKPVRFGMPPGYKKNYFCKVLHPVSLYILVNLQYHLISGHLHPVKKEHNSWSSRDHKAVSLIKLTSLAFMQGSTIFAWALKFGDNYSNMSRLMMIV